MRFAIVDEGIVTNVIWLNPSNAGDFPAAVPIGEAEAGIGDTYTDGVFRRGDAPLLSHLGTAEATIAALDAAVLELEYQNALLALGLS